MIKLKEIIKEAIEETFEEREKFVDSLADQEIRQANYCPIHKVYYREDKCSICEGEKKFKENVEDIKSKGLLVGNLTQDYFLKEKEKKKKRDKEYMKKKLENADQKKKHYERVLRSQKKERIRKSEHSLI